MRAGDDILKVILRQMSEMGLEQLNLFAVIRQRLLHEIMIGTACACAARDIRCRFPALAEDLRIAAHEVAVFAAVVLVDEPYDLADRCIRQRIHVVYMLDVHIHDDMAGEFLQDVLEGGDLHAAKFVAVACAEVKLQKLLVGVLPDLARAVGDAVEGGIVDGDDGAVFGRPPANPRQG